MRSMFPFLLRRASLMAALSLLCLSAQAQTPSRSSDSTKTEDADISKMGHFKLRSYLKEHGLKTASGAVIRVGDELTIGTGSLMDKRYAFIYQSPQGLGSGSSYDGEIKAYLKSEARGRKARVKSFMTSGMKRGQYSIYVVVGVGELDNYWVEMDNAIEAGEIILPKR